MKNNKNSIILVVGAVIILVLGALMFMKKPAPETTDTTSPEKVTEEKESDSMMDSAKNTLVGLISAGKSVQCDFAYTPEGQKTETSGTVSVSGKKMRGDFNVDVDGKMSQMSMIRDDEYSYIWGSTMPQGIKMKVEAGEVEEDNAEMKKYFDPSMEMNYKCKPWVSTPADFTPPSNVKFQDMSAIMENAKTTQCATCASLSGEAQATCKKQLGCE